jgi:GTPase SAR1 family protein
LKDGETCADIATGDCLKLFEDLKLVKVLVLGKENVGKTTLVKRIIGEWKIGNRIKSFAFGADTRIPTDGIEMKQWKPEGMKHTVIYFWDFAGQELYYATHHFFLSQNSINIIVFDCTKSLEENRLLFWLNSIQSMGFGSSILMVGSFTDQLKNKNEIGIISDNIDSLITSWQDSIPFSQRSKLFRYQWNGISVSFYPLNCIRSKVGLESLCSRYS